jgi:hypothetical protein
MSSRNPGSPGGGDSGTEALPGTLKEKGATGLWNPKQGAPGPVEVWEYLLEEMSPEISLEGREGVRKGFLAEIPSLSKKKNTLWEPAQKV